MSTADETRDAIFARLGVTPERVAQMTAESDQAQQWVRETCTLINGARAAAARGDQEAVLQIAKGVRVMEARIGCDHAFALSIIAVATNQIVSMTTQTQEGHFEHKPWHDAKPGEVWVLEIAGTGSLRAWQITDRRSHFWALGVGYHAVTARDILSGRRIWPEEATS